MHYAFIENSQHARLYLHKVKLKFDIFRNDRTISSSVGIPKIAEKVIETNPSTGNGKRQHFDEMVSFRKKEARSSVIIQVGNPSKSSVLLNKVCYRHGNVKNLFHYTCQNKELLLLEFDSESSVKNLLASCSHNNNYKVIPVVSPFLWLKATPTESCTAVSSRLPAIIKENISANDKLQELLSNAKSISEQITILNDQTRLSEIGHRLRWITCIQIEQMLSRLFPSLQVLPFGSFVNGSARNGCDLDMAISLDGNYGAEIEALQSPLIFQAKAVVDNNRFQTQKHLEIFADLVQNYATGCIQIQRIMRARVPIIKFHHEFTGIDCDISMSLSGVFMSELLYLYDKIDWRFCPLVTAVRQWASWAKLTSATPGSQITNFTLTLMVVFFLQRRSPPILPTLDEMIKFARPQVDTRQTEDINCTFLRDPSVFQVYSKLNSESLEDLFIGFLRFVESFDFSERTMSIITGDSHRKFDSKPLYVQNPLERELNVSRNVTLTELTRAVMEARNALYILETQENQGPGENWGLLSLPRAKSIRQTKQEMTHSNHVNINIKDLFRGDFDEEISDFTEAKLSDAKSVEKVLPSSLQTSAPLKQLNEKAHLISDSNATNGAVSEVQVQIKTGLKGTNGSKHIALNKILLSVSSNKEVKNFSESKPTKSNIDSKTISSSTVAPLVSGSIAKEKLVDQVQRKARLPVNKTQKNVSKFR